jgi:exosortase E/protease (VPEID-CTERM system)
VAAIFALNVVRLSVLILIGNAGFHDVAVYGFHSQAGWIAFICVACGLVLLSRRSTWLNRAAVHAQPAVVTHNPTAAFLMPLLAILAAGTVAHALSSDFEFLYVLRVIAGTWMLLRYRRTLAAAMNWSWSWRGIAVGAAVFVIWIIAAHFVAPPTDMPAKLAALPPAWRWAWVALRIVGSVLIVPIAEELAYRGFLMRRLVAAEFEAVPLRAVGSVALGISSVVFGAVHGSMWAAGVAAGLAYGMLAIRRDRLGEAVAAHLVSNALVAAAVLLGGQWQLW